MPRYRYYCDACLTIFEEWHSMTEILNTCSKCNCEDRLTRVPSQISNPKKFVEKQRVGSVVDEHIRKTKEEIRKTKQEMREGIKSDD